VDDAIRVNDRVVIPRAELTFRASRAGGPGGQHVNTSSTRVELSWNLDTSRALDDVLRERARTRLANRLDADGVLRVTASETRSQLRNREAAERRLVELLRTALRAPRPRIATRPSRAAKEERLDAKRKRGEKKKARRRPDLEE
jgi:ribosome-associated protein